MINPVPKARLLPCCIMVVGLASLLCLFWTPEAAAQNGPPPRRRGMPPPPGGAKKVTMHKASTPIAIDGVLDDAAWQASEVTGGFRQTFPSDSLPAQARTEVRVAFDESYLYVAAVCHDPNPGPYAIPSLRRDFDFFNTDNFHVYLDPFNDRVNGFSFGVSPMGVLREGLIANGDRVSTDWDNKWQAKVTTHEDHWIVEMAIPFRTLRYNHEAPHWNVQFVRIDSKANERSAWSPVPQGFRLSSLAFAGQLNWDAPPPKAGKNIVLIPYVAGGATIDYEAAAEAGVDPSVAGTYGVGLDAKVGITPQLNLDLTVNPDFSQVEVDRQVTNLSRFELFFPERRQFFLENSDLFGQFGFRRIRPFFSRRIGLGVPIIAGARLSGKVGADWRVGMLNMQTAEGSGPGDEVIFPENFTVGAVQRQFGRSNLALIVVNRQTFLPDSLRGGPKPGGPPPPPDAPPPPSLYNRVLGVDYNLRTADDRWAAKVFYHRSFSPETTVDSTPNVGAYAHAGFLGFRTRNVFAAWNHEVVGGGYNASTGFVPRTNYIRFEPFVNYSFILNKHGIQRHGPRSRADIFYDFDGTLRDRNLQVGYRIQFMSTSDLRVDYRNAMVRLIDPFDPTNTDGTQLPADSVYQWSELSMNFQSDRRRLFSFQAGGLVGGYYNGQRFNLNGNIRWRWQPYANLFLNVNYNSIQLPEGFNSTNFWLVGPRLDLTFTDKVFLTTFVQYNSQAENMNLNARLQYRFRPVSDLFLVYSENYLSSDFSSKNRALVFKFTYWLNL